ncbi:hypothetical protein EX30DRAFT_328712 [Ascodesmis nigricans]|uniref:Exoribonuclease phosphorolytic domain-containing protein n=1 Tax=Ascodesmis nigricans TaxID=341454 RepID=A0A4S2N1B1_9PEZI|nr:hypothetical protein EX30DRAFT_328712 [Ascodesmis nigricans]
MTIISATTTLLSRADGSAQVTSSDGTTLIASVSGPMEVRPREEQPLRAYLEVLVRPVVGVAGTRERLLESQLVSCLTPIIRLESYPRTCIQVNIQLLTHSRPIKTSRSSPPPPTILSTALNASILALIDASTALRTTVAATDITINKGRHTVVVDVFSGQLVFVDSEGEFTHEELEEALERGKKEGMVRVDDGGDVMVVDEGGGVGEEIRRVVEEKVQRDLRWKDGK